MRQYFRGHRIGNYLRPPPEHDLIYVKNPKAGCSTILLWLDRLHTGDHGFEPSNIHKENRLPTVREVGRPVVEQMLSGAAYRFSFVRNPLRRFESVYWDKLVPGSRLRLKAPAALSVWPDPHTFVSFEQFLTAVEQQDPMSDMNPHWRPQHVNLLHPLISYDRLGRLENFESDLERIRAEVGLPDVPIEVRNASKQARTDSVYDNRPDLVRRVEQIYAKDFELYGY